MLRIPLKAIQAFEAAARHESFALAAEELFLTPSAISHQVKYLEEVVGVRLFHRVHRAVILTDSGRRYAEQLSTAFASIDTATRHIGRAEKSDILTVHSTPSIAAQWLMPRLARFSSLYPDIDVRVHASPVPADLTTGAVDIDIRYSMRKLQSPGVMMLTFPQETIVPLCSPALAAGPNPIREADDLCQHNLIHSEGCLVGWRDWSRQYRKIKLDISRGPSFDRSFMSISAAVDGLGVCLESLLLAQRELDSGRLVAPLGLDGLKVQGYSLNLLKSRADLPKISCFHDWLFRELSHA